MLVDLAVNICQTVELAHRSGIHIEREWSCAFVTFNYLRTDVANADNAFKRWVGDGEIRIFWLKDCSSRTQAANELAVIDVGCRTHRLANETCIWPTHKLVCNSDLRISNNNGLPNQLGNQVLGYIYLRWISHVKASDNAVNVVEGVVN